MIWRRPFIGTFTSDAGPGFGKLIDAIGDVIFTEVGIVSPEGIGLDTVHTNGEIRVMNPGNYLWPGDVQDLIAPLMPLEILEGRIGCLEHGAHSAVGNHYSGGEGLAKA